MFMTSFSHETTTNAIQAKCSPLCNDLIFSLILGKEGRERYPARAPVHFRLIGETSTVLYLQAVLDNRSVALVACCECSLVLRHEGSPLPGQHLSGLGCGGKELSCALQIEG